MVKQLAGRASEVGETLMLKTIEEGISSGEIKGTADSRVIGKAILTFIHGFSSAATGHTRLLKKEEIPSIVDVFLEGIKQH